MVSASGILRISTDGHFEFTSQNIRIEGVYAQFLHREVVVPAIASFEREGPYNLNGDLGTRGVYLRFSGPVGNGTIDSTHPVPVGLTEIRGSGNVTIKRD